jgi:apolipoprotein N-acyltransferase
VTRLALGAHLLVGGALVSLSTGPALVAAAAWLAPLALLRVTRTHAPLPGLALAAVAHALGYLVAWQGTYGLPAAAFALLGLLFFVPYVVDRLVTARLRGPLGALAYPTALVALEHLLVTVPVLSGQPLGTWGSLAHSQAGNLPLLQLLALTGTAGVTFLVATFGSLGAWALTEGTPRAQRQRVVTGYAALLAVVLLGGGWRLAAAPSAPESVRVAGIAVDNAALTVGIWNPVARGRGISESDLTTMRARLDDLHQALLDATVREARAGARIVVWAEDDAIVFAEDEAALLARAAEVARSEGIHLFVGMVALVPGEKAENKVVALTPDGNVAFSYLKSFPTPWEASRAGDRVLRFVDTPYGTVGAAICYDADHPSLLRQAGRAGADIVVVPADDGMQVPWLHAEMATFRAIEGGFSLIRPVIGGRALAVDPYGRVLAEASYGEGAYFAGGTHVLVAHLPTQGVATPYARWGDWWAQLCVAALLVMAVAAMKPTARTSTAPVAAAAD